MRLVTIGECSGAPLPGGATSCHLVEDGDGRVLLDIGSGALSMLGRCCSFDIIQAIFISHFHADHFADAGAAIYSRLISQDLGRGVGPLRFYALEDRGLSMEGRSTFTPIDEGEVVKEQGFTLSFLRTRHPVPCLAIKVRKDGKTIVYTADGGYDERLADFARGADILLAECSFPPGMGKGALAGHMGVDEVSRLANEARPGKLVLTHLPIYGGREAILEHVGKAYDGTVLLAQPLLEVEA